MDRSASDDVEQLLSRAEEARAVSALMCNRESQLMMLQIAQCYQRLAELAAKTALQASGLPEKRKAPK